MREGNRSIETMKTELVDGAGFVPGMIEVGAVAVRNAGQYAEAGGQEDGQNGEDSKKPFHEGMIERRLAAVKPAANLDDVPLRIFLRDRHERRRCREEYGVKYGVKS